MGQAPTNTTGDGNTDHPWDDPLGRLSATPCFGRAPLLASVHAAFEGTRGGRGHALLLLGEAGIGKTRLADEFSRLAQASGIRPVATRCHDMQGAPALWPWLQIVRQLAAGLEPAALGALLGDATSPLLALLPEFADRSPTPPRSEVIHEGDDRYRLYESVTALIRRAASDSPLLVILDDLHWSDPASVLLARYAVRELRHDAVVFVGLYRDTEVDSEAALHQALGDLAHEAEVFRLEGLDQSEVTHFVEHVAGFEVSDVLSAALYAQTGGNPLFLVEVLRLLANEGRLGDPDGPTPEAIPFPLTVHHTLQRRLDALPLETRAILEQAAVIGSEFDLEILEAALPGPGESAKALDEALAARLVQRVADVSGRFRFVHDLIRETLDEDLSITERALVHRRTADAIVKTRAATLDEHYVALAHHYLESASTGTAREAVDFATRGAARAAATFSFELAVQLFANAIRALDLVDAESGPSPESRHTRTAILIDMGHALWQSGQREEARTTHQAAANFAQRLEDPALLAQAAIGLAGRNDVPMDFPDSSVELMEQALEALPRDDSRLRVRLLAHLVRAKYFGDERERLLGWAREAVEIATRLDDPGARFAALESLHYALLVPAHLEERLVVSKQLPELARKTGSLRFEALAWLWRAFDLLQVPDINSADAAITRFEEAARKLRQPFYEWLATGLRATRAQMSGRLDEAERLIFRAFELGQRADSPNAFPFFGTQLFHLRVAQGRVDELLPVMQKIVDESPAQPVFRIGIPLIHALADRREESLRSFEQVAVHDFDDVPHDLHRLPMLSSAAIVCAYLGDTRRAEILLAELEPEAGRIIIAGVATYWGGPIDHCLGLLEEVLERLDGAETHLASAERAAVQGGARLIEAHIKSDHARILRRRAASGDLARATRLEDEADVIFRELGLAWQRPVMPPAASSSREHTDASGHSNRFLRLDRSWLLEYEGTLIELPHSKGLAYLQRLVASPNEDLHVVDLIAPIDSAVASRSPDPSGGGSIGHTARLNELPIEMLDPKARRAYRARLFELDRLRGEAERDHDLARLSAVDSERDQIESELRIAFGLAGRPRSISDPTERARKAVYNRIRAAIGRIERDHPAMGRHLGGSVRTGTTCCYRPERSTEWLITNER